MCSSAPLSLCPIRNLHPWKLPSLPPVSDRLCWSRFRVTSTRTGLHVDTIPLFDWCGSDGVGVTLVIRRCCWRMLFLLLAVDCWPLVVKVRQWSRHHWPGERKNTTSFGVCDCIRWWVKVKGPLAMAAETTSPSKVLLTHHPHAANIDDNYRMCTTSIRSRSEFGVIVSHETTCLWLCCACVRHWLVLSAARRCGFLPYHHLCGCRDHLMWF